MSRGREERLLPLLLLLLERKAVKSRERKESRTGRPLVKKKKKVWRLHEKTGFSGNEVLAAATREGRKTHAAPEPSRLFLPRLQKKKKKKTQEV